MQQKYFAEVGQTFGRLTVARLRVVKGKRACDCICACGGASTPLVRSLCLGLTTSCGCAQREAVSTHQCSNLAEYRVWRSMRSRCCKQTDANYHFYGGRGIAVDPSWASFTQFYADMGPRPSSAHSLDRVNNGRGYSKENCRWATAQEQQQNKRNTRLTKDLVQFARARYAAGENCVSIGRSVGQSAANIRAVVAGKTWTNVH